MRQAERSAVVVIDDDLSVRESLRFLLEAAGYRVETYASALSYILAAPEPRAVCLVVDHHMPDVTGLRLLEILRQLRDVPPVLLITASPDPALLRAAAALGVRKVLAKPLDDVDLVAEIQAAMA